MLARLSIRDVVLIDRLDLSFGEGLGVLTGETGAGKSILLDSLGLALGERADSGLVRPGAEQLTVTAAFDLALDHPVQAVLSEQGLDPAEGSLVVRRVVARDGRSRAFVNDQPVSVGLLKSLAALVVEVHGQFESHGLLNPASHRPLLDSYGDLSTPVAACRAAWATWRTAAAERTAAEQTVTAARAEEDMLRHAEGQLATLAPVVGEESQLAERRHALMNGEKLTQGLTAAQSALESGGGGGGVEGALRLAQRHLQKLSGLTSERLTPILDALERAALEAAEADDLLQRAASEIDLDPRHLEEVERRLFALRAEARKHGVAADALPGVLASLRERLAALDDGGAQLVKLAKAEEAARQAYLIAARTLSTARKAVAGRFDAAVAHELPPLKLDRAVFVTRIDDLPEDQWGPEGLDRAAFEVATNPGSPPGAIGKIASGGELARFMLAMKVVLAATTGVGTLIFDEVDAGIGGATAAAVGERLARLAERVQVLVVTHSPQVAAKASGHWLVAKATTAEGTTATSVTALDASARREEVARMLSGDTITREARAAAARLMGVA